jgi:protein-tyrosine phosphatase
MKILYVCLGNICRSPAQQCVSEQLVKEWTFDSCAIAAWNVGEDMNLPMRRALEKKGYRPKRHQAKVFRREFFQEFDYIFAVTQEVKDFLLSRAKGEEKKKVYLASHFSHQHKGEEIPDPYMREEEDFDTVLDMIETIAKETVNQLKS